MLKGNRFFLIFKKHLDPPEADCWGCGLPHPHGSVGCLGAENIKGSDQASVFIRKSKRKKGLEKPRAKYFVMEFTGRLSRLDSPNGIPFEEESRTNI